MSRMGRRPLLRMLPLVDLSVVKILLTAGTALMFATTAVRGQRSEVIIKQISALLSEKLSEEQFYINTVFKNIWKPIDVRNFIKILKFQDLKNKCKHEHIAYLCGSSCGQT